MVLHVFTIKYRRKPMFLPSNIGGNHGFLNLTRTMGVSCQVSHSFWELLSSTAPHSPSGGGGHIDTQGLLHLVDRMVPPSDVSH